MRGIWKKASTLAFFFLYAENHSLGEWFKRRLVAIMETKNSLC